MKWTGAVVGIVLTLSLYQSSPIEAFVPVVPIAVPTTTIKTTKTITTKTRPAVWLQSKTLTNTSPLWRIQSTTTTTTMTAATTTDSINGTTTPKSNMGKLQTILVKVRTILKLCSNQKSDLLH